jgi:regulator of sigma E protease
LDHHDASQRPPGLSSQPGGNGPPADNTPQSFRDWLVGNSVTITIVGAVILFLGFKFVRGDMDVSTLLNIGKVALGLSLVVFIHELGHFLVAKWCDVQVDTFSIGFGPAIPGCSFKWGETTYKLALFPLGGYVKMLGQVDGDESDDPENDENPRSYRNKTVWQRMAIISAGVVMNVLLAIVCFILVYTHGVKRAPAVVGQVVSGGGAWEKGVPSGAVFTQINNRRDPSFNDLRRTVLRSREGEKVKMVYYLPPDTQEHEAIIEPRVAQGTGRPVVGLDPPLSLVLAPGSLLDSRPYPVHYNSAAAAARRAFDLKPGDSIVATTDPDHPDRLAPLPDPSDRAKYVFTLAQRWTRLAGKPMTLAIRRPGVDTPVEVQTVPDSFLFEDTIVATTDPDNPGQITSLPPDEHNPGSGLGDYFALRHRLDRLADEFMTFRVRRANGEEVDLVVPPAYHVTFGAEMEMGAVQSIRDGSPAMQAGVQVGNILQKVVLTDAQGQRAEFITVRANGDKAPNVGPLRLPDALRQWAEGRKGVKAVLWVGAPKGTDELTVQQRPPVDWDTSVNWQDARDVPLNSTSPVAIPQLGLAYMVLTRVEQGAPDSRPGDRLETDDVVKQIRQKVPSQKPGEAEDDRWVKLEPDQAQWPWVFHHLQTTDFKDVTVRVERKRKPDGTRKPGEPEVKELELTAQPDPTWPLPDRGLILQEGLRTVKAANLGQAVMLGMQDTYDQIMDVFYNIRGMVTQRISPKHMGGPIQIADIAYRVAKVDFWDFLFFLGAISINLAVINFLPIPVLDGGHMVFLVYEKLRGRPASEQVRIAATYVGLFLIASLMFFVFYLDISRYFSRYFL